MTTPHSPPSSSSTLAVQPRWRRTDAEMLDQTLQPFTMAWLKTLPEPVRPLACARHYPRVLNRIAALWGLPERCLDLLADLQTDRRGDRKGFGHGVVDELRHLQAYRVTLMPPREPDFPPTVPMHLA
jgi:hypothetical protein